MIPHTQLYPHHDLSYVAYNAVSKPNVVTSRDTGNTGNITVLAVPRILRVRSLADASRDSLAKTVHVARSIHAATVRFYDTYFYKANEP
jgi:hypothetical protein